MGSRVALLRFFNGVVYSEIEAFRDLFNLEANIIAAGGILDTQGAVIFEVEGEKVKEAMDFAFKYNSLILESLL